jgi:hypothetical protein
MVEKAPNKAHERSFEHHRHMEEKWHKDPLGGILFGAIVILAGVLLFVDHQYYLEGGWFWWFLAGIGVIFLIEAMVRYAMPEYRRPIGGKLVAAVILLAIGASNIYGLEDWWPVLIIVAGIVIIFYGLQARKEPKA